MSANRKLSEDIDKHNAAVTGLIADRDALLIALSNCAVDIENLMHDQFGDTAIMPLSHDRARALLAIKRP